MQKKVCPRCRMVKELVALSRRDNRTMICNDCGNEEAFIDAGIIARTPNEIAFVDGILRKKKTAQKKRVKEVNRMNHAHHRS